MPFNSTGYYKKNRSWPTQDEEDSMSEQTVSRPTEGLTPGSVKPSGGLPTGAQFLNNYVDKPFNINGFRRIGSTTEYDPSKDQTARSVVDGVEVPRQVGAPIQIDPKYGGGVGTVINPVPSSMGSTTPAAPSFAAPPERQPVSLAAPAMTAGAVQVLPGVGGAPVGSAAVKPAEPTSVVRSTMEQRADEMPAKQFLSNLDGLEEWSRSRGGLQTGGVQSSNGLGLRSSDVNTLARRLQAQERFDYKIAQAAARRNGVQGRVPRAAIGLGGGSYGDYLAEAQDRLAVEKEGAESTQANNALLKSFLDERLRAEKQRNDAEADRLEAVRAAQGLRK